MRKLKPVLLTLLCVGFLRSCSGGRAAAQESRAAEVYRRTLHSTAWVINPGAKVSGTAWVVDRAQRLLVTNQHVVDNEDRVVLVFPAYRNGQVISERSYYTGHLRSVAGRVVDAAVKRDLAVIQVDSLPEGIEELPLAAASPDPGESIYSIGNPGASEALWVFTSGRVRSVYHRHWATDMGKAVIWRDARVVESSSPTNPGDSGGPVVNGRGELVAVTEGDSRTGRLVSWSIDVSVVRQFLGEVRRLMNPRGVDDFYLEGYRYLLRGRFDQAIAAYTEVLRLNPHNAWAFNNRGNCFLGKSDYDTAIADYSQALRLDPRYAFAYHNRGMAWNRKGDYDRAIADQTQAIQIDPRYAEAYFDRAVNYGTKGQYHNAIADYNRAIDLDPTNAMAFNNRGWNHYKLKEPDAALVDYNRSLKLNPYNALCWCNRCNVFFDRRDYQQALKDSLEALKVDPKCVFAFEGIGSVYRVTRDYRRAISAYSEAIRLNSRDAFAYYWRGRSYEALGEQDQAQQDIAEAIRLDPSYANQGN
jgi:tetratricopeptide (TPR) repeat protein